MEIGIGIKTGNWDLGLKMGIWIGHWDSYIDSNGKILEILALLALLALIALLDGVSSMGKCLPIRMERFNCSLA